MLVTLVISKHNYYFCVGFFRRWLFFCSLVRFFPLIFRCNVSDVNLSFDWLNVLCYMIKLEKKKIRRKSCEMSLGSISIAIRVWAGAYDRVPKPTDI